MSYRHIEPRIILPQQTISGVTAVNSQIHDMRTMNRGALQFQWGSGLTATIAVFASCAPAQYNAPPAASNFFDLLLGLPAIAGSAGQWGVDLTAYGYPWYMGVVTPSSGSGTMLIWANAKSGG